MDNPFQKVGLTTIKKLLPPRRGIKANQVINIYYMTQLV